MGCFVQVKITEKLCCCGRESDDWQSKDVEIFFDNQYIMVDNLCQTMNVSAIASAEIHAWCGLCKFMTRLKILDGKVAGKYK